MSYEQYNDGSLLQRPTMAHCNSSNNYLVRLSMLREKQRISALWILKRGIIYVLWAVKTAMSLSFLFISLHFSSDFIYVRRIAYRIVYRNKLLRTLATDTCCARCLGRQMRSQPAFYGYQYRVQNKYRIQEKDRQKWQSFRKRSLRKNILKYICEI